MSTEKVRPTDKDILRALRVEIGEGLNGRPRNATELARAISFSYGHSPWGEPQVHRPTLNRVLAELSADFSIIGRSGDQWERLAPSTHGMADRFVYYALPEHLEEWRKAALSRVERSRQVRAESQAKDELAEQFPNEYQLLVRRALKKAQREITAPE